jgi:hypothetical protein
MPKITTSMNKGGAKMLQYEFHEAAYMYPMYDEEKFRELVEDIRVNGQHMPIILYHGLILDGRNRYNACLELEIEPKFEQWNEQGNLLDYVKSMNEIRRQLTVSQESMAAARYKELYPKYAQEAKERQKALAGTRPNSNPDLGAVRTQGDKGRTNEIIGEQFGVSATSVKRATNVLDKGTPELIQAVDSGTITVNKADEIAKLPKEVQQVAIEQAKAPKKADVAKENAEYIQEHSFELTEEDKEIQRKMEEINDYLTKRIVDLRNAICSSSTASHVVTDVAIFAEAMRKHADNLDSDVQQKMKMESEEND